MWLPSAVGVRLKQALRVGGAFALTALLLVGPVATSRAGDSNTAASGNHTGSDIGQGAGLHVSADDWLHGGMAMAGSGNQAGSISGSANTGSGRQDNATSDVSGWKDTVNANAGTGAQVIQSVNANGRDRTASDVGFRTGDADNGLTTTASTDITGSDVSRGSGIQVNADDWLFVDVALAGSGNQAGSISGSANTGSGRQDNAISDAAEWEGITNANAGTGAQVIRSANANGRDRTSNGGVVFLTDNLDGGKVSHSTLESSVANNSVTVSGDNGSANSSLGMGGGRHFSGMMGVNTIAISTGANASQNISVSVVGSVSSGP